MILYHGSNVAVIEPKIISSDRKLDFGSGFYLTTSLEQAMRWADLTTQRRKSGKGTVTAYDFDEKKSKDLKILIFEKPDFAWLKYTANNRNGVVVSDDYDIVSGPVANDRTAPVLTAYFSGIYNEEETIKRLIPQKLKDQFAFKTEQALKCLTVCEVISK